MLCLILLVLLFSRRCYWRGYGYGNGYPYTPYGGYSYGTYPFGAYSAYSPQGPYHAYYGWHRRPYGGW